MSAVTLEGTPRIRTIRLDRPEKFNALTREMLEALSYLLCQLADDEQLRALILTGAGKAFCAGTDIGELTDLDKNAAFETARRGQKVCDQLEHFPVPVIAAVNGIAAGGGFELVLASHLRLASSNAQFSLPETELGLIPGYGGTQRLTREIGHARALEVTLTGENLDAEKAKRLGIVNRIVEAHLLMNEAMALAEEIASLSPLAIRSCLQAVIMGAELPLDEALSLEAELFSRLFSAEDVREGTRAFLEKRKPVFK
jgi:enoyl-CoA hydratase